MLLIIVLAIALIAGVAAAAIYHVAGGRNAAPDLEGDWWTEFEQQFRAYAARHEASHRRLEN
jgi:hypothetical protein